MRSSTRTRITRLSAGSARRVRMIELADKSVKTPVREASPRPQVQRVDRRLSAEMIAEPAV